MMAKNNKTHSFKFVKNQDFKTIGVSGVFGAMTLRGLLNINFYVDTIDLPKVVKHEVTPANILGAEIPSPPSLETFSIREVPFGVNIDIPTAKSMIIWMQKHITEFEDRNKAILQNQQVSSDNTK
jgi:hypothetical protein